MTLTGDVETIRGALQRQGGQIDALDALRRIEKVLPEPTLWDQFEHLPVGTQFQTNDSDRIHYMKVGDKAVVRVDASWVESGPSIEYVDDMEERFPFWGSRTDTFTVVL